MVRRWQLRAAGSLVALAGLFAGPPAASASVGSADYSSTAVSGQYEEPPADATDLQMIDANDERQVSLPFAFPYFGVRYDDVWVTLGGMVQFGIGRAFASGNHSHLFAGQVADDWPPEGVCAPHWAWLDYGNVVTWTAGTAPNRRFIVSWVDVRKSLTNYEHRWFQAKFLEGSGKIVFAYRPETHPATWVDNDYACGIVAAGEDDRWMAPVTGAAELTGHPSSDWELTPRTVTCSGRVVYDRIVPGEGGIPSTPVTDVPAAGVRVELRYANVPTGGDPIAASAVTDDDGDFVFTTFCGSTSLGSELHLIVASDDASVHTGTATAPVSTRLVSSMPFTGGDLGTFRISATADPSAAVRAPLAIHSAIRRARSWARTHTGTEIPAVTARYAATGATATSYDAAAKTLHVAGPQATNPDAWDEPVVVRTWGRHLLASLAAAPTGTTDDRYDAFTTAEDAFAVGFGLHVWAAVSGEQRFVDGTGASSATVIELESPSFGSAPGPAVAASVADALHDLLDAANEPADEFDGTSAAGLVLQTADTMSEPPTSDSFLDAWYAQHHDEAGITRLWIRAGLLADDAFEPNDRGSETAPLGPAGFVRRGLALQRFQEDWFSVVVPPSGGILVADFLDEATSSDATVGVDVRSEAGEILATGAPQPSTSAMHVFLPGASAGSYRIVVRHLAGGPVASYSLQALLAPSLTETPLRDWTVGRPCDFPLDVRDGIPPYTLRTIDSAPPPPGIVFREDTLRAAGTPLATGTYGVTLQAWDSGRPANVATRTVTVTIHDVLRFALPGLACFPAGRDVDRTLATTGGTPPFAFAVTSGSLPGGLAFDPGTVRVTGAAEEPGSTDLELDGTDVAGSADHTSVRAVVAVEARGKGAPSPLAAGSVSCGWWFDAVEGSTVSVAVTTAKKHPKRNITGVLIGPDGAVVPTGVVRTKPGAVNASKLVCPASGRHFFVVTAQDGGPQTSLAATVVSAPRKKAKAALTEFPPDDTTTIRVGALPGSTLVLKFSGEKRTSLVGRIHEIRRPDGSVVAYGELVKSTPLGGTLTMKMETGGTWTVVLGARSTTGAEGKLSWSYSVRVPKGATWEAE